MINLVERFRHIDSAEIICEALRHQTINNITNGRDIIQVRWKTLISFCRKFIQETVYRILSESPEFCRRYDNKHFGLIFLDTL